MSVSSRPSDERSHDRRARLRRRLVGGVFTALIGLQWGTSLVAQADAVPANAEPATTLEARAERVREALLPELPATPARADDPAQPWGNGWINWSNGWNNWKNQWNNWNNAWNNWNNAWNNWSNWKNAWYNV